MPALGNNLDFNQYQGLRMRAHVTNPAPTTPTPQKGQLYFNDSDNTLYFYDGSTWISTKSGSPTGAAGGDLSGTYPNPQIAAGVIVDADVNGSAAIQESKLNLATDAAVGTGSRRTLGSGAQQAMPGNRTLDAITVAAADVNLNSKKITSLADPTTGTDAANKQYVDTTVQGLDAKASVRAASTGNLTLSGTQTVDGVVLGVNDAILVKDQSTAAQNGIYLVASGAWTRRSDMDAWAEFASAYTWVEDGTVNGDTGWTCTVPPTGTLGSTAVTWVQFAAAGAAIAGAGLTKTGNTLDVGAGSGITVAADSVGIANNGVTNAMLADGAVDLATADVTGTLPLIRGGLGQTTAKTARESTLISAGYYSSATHGAGTTITVTAATHGLRATRGLIVQVQDEATGAVEYPDASVAANGDVTVTYGTSQSANSKRVTVLG